jgi:hypothetical protein
VGQGNQGDFGDVLQIVFNPVFDDVVDVDDELLEFVEALVDVVEVGVNVHAGPSEGGHAGVELEFHVGDVWA